MLFVLARKINSAMTTTTLLGNGTKVSATEAGMWVKTMVLMRPIRRAMEEATRLEALEDEGEGPQRALGEVEFPVQPVGYPGGGGETRGDTVDGEEEAEF